MSASTPYILVVDDNERIAQAIGTLLRRDGYEVETAYDGETALKVAQDTYPEAIILDLDLPGKSGYEVARTLKRELHSSVLLIALTGYGQREDKQKAREAGFDYHLTKPILIADIEKLLAQRSGKAK